MKIKSIMTMAMAAIALVLSVSSCNDDDDEQKVDALARQVVGAYNGSNVITTMGETDSFDDSTYEFTQYSENSVSMVIPQSGEGMMTIPPLTVKDIPLRKVDNRIIGDLSSYSGTVLNASGSEKAFTISDLTAIFEEVSGGKAVFVSYTLKYGSMPFDMATQFTGNK